MIDSLRLLGTQASNAQDWYSTVGRRIHRKARRRQDKARQGKAKKSVTLLMSRFLVLLNVTPLFTLVVRSSIASGYVLVPGNGNGNGNGNGTLRAAYEILS